MEDYISSDTANFNEKWLINIYDNIKKLEEYERIIREGCSSVLEFAQIPLKSKPIVIGLTQFKTLRFFITEFKLLLADLTPILEAEDAKEFDKVLSNIDKALPSEKLFLNSSYDINKNLVGTSVTPFFNETLDTLHKLKVDLFKKIKHILYLTRQNG